MASKISLPVRLGVLVAGTLLPLIIFAGVIVYQHHVEKREEAFDRVMQLVRSTRLILDSEVRADDRRPPGARAVGGAAARRLRAVPPQR